MGSLRVRLVDANRYSKRYPLVRAPVRNTYLGTTPMSVEIGSIYFNNAESGTLVFDAPFIDSGYQVAAVARSTGNETADVNVFISAKSQNSVTVSASSNFTGYVDIFAVRVG
jgi:hypothetical protein